MAVTYNEQAILIRVYQESFSFLINIFFFLLEDNGFTFLCCFLSFYNINQT